ncbi:hypothetical protein E8L99_21790 [Phreatobacter aquaticus]|uniref:Uncharacterized protein n=1 Tax=Phreatobacter aquaticus TaxID=2570229 RepID=A0A4D7QNZ2_9HYPH|nr:hypothetical protein [Phreatobacter aquaticus]QCK88201.1 hypothetical protein E8L99_21790 [Phreatobacter aquaticus]
MASSLQTVLSRPSRALLVLLALGAIGTLMQPGEVVAQQAAWTCKRNGDNRVPAGTGNTQDQAFRSVRSNCARTYQPTNQVAAMCSGPQFTCSQPAAPSWYVCSDASGRFRQSGSDAAIAKMGAVNACTAASGGGAAYGTCLNAVTCRASNN